MPSIRAVQHGSALDQVSVSSWTTFGGSFYHAMVFPLAICTLLLGWSALPSRSAEWPMGFGRFMVTYLSAWTLCVAADWLQGPYVYALYEAYGFSSHEIAQLFVAGFGSAMLCSCFVGGLADRFGRKKGCLAYCMLYILSCATKHWKNYWILMLGRITGGFATSLLFSCFECWMVSEHTCKHQFSSGLLSYMFGMKFTIMYLVAIVSGLVAQVGVDSIPFSPVDGSILYYGGNVVAFDMSAAVLVIAMVVISTVWDENYGTPLEEAAESEGESSLKEAWMALFTSSPLIGLCVIVACFEGSMYSFVFNWTPSLETAGETPPHGVVFALMMMACMCGASTSTLISEKVCAIQRLKLLSVLGVAAFTIASLTAQHNAHVCFVSFLLFEFCVGIYFPSVGGVKSEMIPERIRATMYNLCRVLLNAVVVSLLLSNIGVVQCFRFCAVLLAVVFLAAMGIKHVAPESPEAFTSKMK